MDREVGLPRSRLPVLPYGLGSRTDLWRAPAGQQHAVYANQRCGIRTAGLGRAQSAAAGSKRSCLRPSMLDATNLELDVDDLVDVEIEAELFVDVDEATGAFELVEDDRP